MRSNPIALTPEERAEIVAKARTRTGRSEDARRARVILMLAEGKTWVEIGEALSCSPDYIRRWKRRFEAERIAGLRSQYPGGKIKVLTPKMEAKILTWTTKRKPSDGSTHWTTRKLAEELGVSHMVIARAWQKLDLKPQRMERYLKSNDPDFEKKAADIIGLYLNPPQHAAVFSVDEKSAIQALDRKDPVLPLSPGRAERHGFEYYRHGTLSLYAAFNTETGAVLGKTAERHTSDEFVAFLADIVASQPADKEIHIIVDNLSAHKTAKVREFLAAHQNVSHPLHPHLFFLDQPGRTVVWQDRARCDRPRSLQFCKRSSTQTDALHSRL